MILVDTESGSEPGNERRLGCQEVNMFKLFFLNLVRISSLEINLALVKENKKYPKLNDGTVRMYHNLFKPREDKKYGRRK